MDCWEFCENSGRGKESQDLDGIHRLKRLYCQRYKAPRSLYLNIMWD